MTLLLVLPAVAVILFQGRGFYGSLRTAMLMLEMQIAIAIPFLATNAKGYVSRAFELTREFKYEWTVNMRMVPEHIFLSKDLAVCLLVSHAAALYGYINRQWLIPGGKSVFAMLPSFIRGRSPFTEGEEAAISRRVTPRFVLATMLTASNLGLFFARSLHYQFYAYLAWSTPFLLWNAGLHPVVIYLVWAAQEWAWNVFPSTTISSIVVVLALAFTDRVTWMWRQDLYVQPKSDAASAEKEE